MHLVLFTLVVGIVVGLSSGFAAWHVFRFLRARLEAPQGFLIRLPYGIVVYGVKTVSGKPEPAAAETRLRLVSRNRRLPEAAGALDEAA